MHSVLGREHVGLEPAGDESVKQGPVETAALGLPTQDRGR